MTPIANLQAVLDLLYSTLQKVQPLLPDPHQPINWNDWCFRWQVTAGHGGLSSVKNPRPQSLDELMSIDRQKKIFMDNTQQFVNGYPANHVLMTGARGTGKSSLVRGALFHYAHLGLRLIEVSKEHLADLPQIVQLVEHRPERFIVYCDDMTFDDQDQSYKALKTVLDGSFTGYAPNVLIYATSNRRHLIPEFFFGQQGLSPA